jgi:YHS domain-containing protein
MEEPFGLKDHSDGKPVKSIDPVCGKAVDEAKAAGKTGWAGAMYYFCSAACQRTFQNDPKRYAGVAKRAVGRQ